MKRLRDWINLPWTRALLKMCYSDFPMENEKVISLLKIGASPWGDSGKRSVFSYMFSLTREHDCFDAWFEAAGDLSKAPWKAYGVASPLLDVIQQRPLGGQEDFDASITLRLLQHNVSLDGADLPGHSLIERLWWTNPKHGVTLITAFVRQHPHLVEGPAAREFLNEISVHSPKEAEKLGDVFSLVQKSSIDANTAEVPLDRPLARARRI